MKAIRVWKLVLIASVVAILLLTAAVGEAHAQGPTYNPPTYQGGWSLGAELQYGYQRGVYDAGYAGAYGQYAWGQAQGFYQHVSYGAFNYGSW